MSVDFYMKVNDTWPALQITMTYNDGTTAVNLTGGTCRFLMKSLDGAVAVSQTATIVTPASGIVRYDWVAADTATEGEYHAEFEATLAAGGIVSAPTNGYINVHILRQME